MRSSRIFLIVVAFAACLRLASGVAQEQKATPSTDTAAKSAKEMDSPFDESALDEKTLHEAKQSTKAADLLQYLRDRTYKDADPLRLAKLAKELGDNQFVVREKAYRELLELGQAALPTIIAAEKQSKEEVRIRAADLRSQIEDRANPAVQAAVVRLLGQRQPEGAAEVLLGFLPFAANESVIEDICKALSKVAVRAGKVEPAIFAGLADRVPLKRGAAGMALAAVGTKDHLDRVRGLLEDPEPTVRLRVSRALVEKARAKDAVQPLIDCLKVLPAEITWPAEELLLRIAGESAPRVSLGRDAASCTKCFEQWNQWWQAHRVAIDLASVDFTHTLLGYTLIVTQPQPKAGVAWRGSNVIEIDAAKNLRWKFDLPILCSSAQVVGPDRVLVVEGNAQRMTERDFSGEIEWEKGFLNPMALSAQRLANGNTFVVTRDMLTEYNPKGTQVYLFSRGTVDTYRGRKLRSGDVIFITLKGEVMKVDGRTNLPFPLFSVGPLGSLYGTLEELPSGNLLISLHQAGRVVEYTPAGKEVWSVPVPMPMCATRLPNGNTLVASCPPGAWRAVEFDRDKREVWSYSADGLIYAVHKR